MGGRLSEAERKKKYSHYASGSPLKMPKTIPDLSLKKDENFPEKRKKDFVLDGVYEHVHKSTVLPSYNAARDPHAQTYFRQPRMQVMTSNTRPKELIPPAVPSHKLSIRKRIPSTPESNRLERRESNFVIDSVRAETTKSRLRPVIPQYDALNDEHAQRYFKKNSVRRLLERTCDIRMK